MNIISSCFAACLRKVDDTKGKVLVIASLSVGILYVLFSSSYSNDKENWKKPSDRSTVDSVHYVQGCDCCLRKGTPNVKVYIDIYLV